MANKRGVVVFTRLSVGRHMVWAVGVGCGPMLRSVEVRPWQTDTLVLGTLGHELRGWE